MLIWVHTEYIAYKINWCSNSSSNNRNSSNIVAIVYNHYINCKKVLHLTQIKRQHLHVTSPHAFYFLRKKKSNHSQIAHEAERTNKWNRKKKINEETTTNYAIDFVSNFFFLYILKRRIACDHNRGHVLTDFNVWFFLFFFWIGWGL